MGGDRSPGASVERLRPTWHAPAASLAAWLEWEPVGTGVSHSLKGGEIVGVVHARTPLLAAWSRG